MVVVAAPRCWFTYYYWEDDALAPDFARTVDIHRKIGYDPVELFLDPKLRFVPLRIAAYLLQKKLGFRGLMRVIPLDATLVRGSHGAPSENENEWPVLMVEKSAAGFDSAEKLTAEAVHNELFRLVLAT